MSGVYTRTGTKQIGETYSTHRAASDRQRQVEIAGFKSYVVAMGHGRFEVQIVDAKAIGWAVLPKPAPAAAGGRHR